MDIDFRLLLPRSELIMGEDVPLTLQLTNTSNRAITLPDPERSRRWPKICVLDLTTKQEKTYGPFDVGKQDQQQFLPPLPEKAVTLAPKGELKTAVSLFSRVDLPGPGDYELTGHIEWPGGDAFSAPVAVKVRPLRLRGADLAGPHSGHAPPLYCLLSHADPRGSVLILGSATLDQDNRPHALPATRLAEVESAARPSLSVTRNGASWPAQWIVWLDGGDLSGLYVMQGQVAVPAKRHALALAGVALVGPALLDLAKAEGLQPAPGHVALWVPGAQGARLAIRTFQPDGSLADGPAFSLGKGDLGWGRAAFLKTGERRFVLAVGRGDEVHLELVRWGTKPGEPTRVAQWPGRAIGGGMTLNADDALFGAAVVRAKGPDGRSAYAIQPWSIAADASASIGEAIPVPHEPDIEFDGAIVEVSPAGKALVLLQTPDKAWFVSGSEGQCAPLPDALAALGDPIGAFWATEEMPLVVLAGPTTGIAYRELRQ